MQYFSLDRIKAAIEHLQEYDSKWVIVPLVFAVNGVGEEEAVNLRGKDQPGTGSFLDLHFHGSLIGLEPLEGGASTMRPRFKEIWKPDDPNFVIHQRQSLWGNAYSRTGYKEMKDRGLIIGSGPSTWQMTPKFWAAWEAELPESFRFEELLVWLYAFSGFDEEIDSWEELSIAFQEQHLGAGGRFPAGYEVRFRIAGDISWPADLSDDRPANEEFQAALLPGPARDDKWLRERFEEWRKEVEYPSPSDENDKKMRIRFAEELLSVEALAKALADPESFDLDLFRKLLAGNYGGPGPQSHINRFLKQEGDAGVARLAATLAFVLYGDGDVAERLDAAVEDPDYYVSGLGEAVLTKCLAVVYPEQWLPLFAYKSEAGKGKRDILKVLDADLEDGDELSMGEAAVRSNDVLRDMTEPLLREDPWGQLVFLWWLREYGGDSSSLGTELHLDDKWIEEVNELLDDKRQVIFYGPPGTGKTYVAQRLAEQYAAGGKVEIVQFHPSYTYEDFVQGYRPVEDKSGDVTFKLRPGPLLDLAEAAKGAETCVLLIDEINRGNLAKIFGELYFLLEYRDRKIKLQYGKEFSLPENLVIIGTMNTADRSIALVDAALRRRFHFVPFFPDRWPIEGLLRRWLKDNVPKMEPVADLVDRVNEMLDDRDFQIGPAYFMKKDLDDRWLDRIWRYSVIPYLEEHFFDDPDRVAEFELEKLQAAQLEAETGKGGGGGDGGTAPAEGVDTD